MNINTIYVSPEESERKLDQYKNIIARQRTREDAELERMYRAVKKGGRVLNLAAAFQQTGLNEKGQPRIAIARADWQTVYCHYEPYDKDWHSATGSLGFTPDRRWATHKTALNIMLPRNTFKFAARATSILESPVPYLPPSVRPRFDLSNYHILFEVKEWSVYPADPFLLHRISGMMFLVLAKWELTPFETEILSALRSNP